jgi:O-antigen ligase
MGYAAVRIARTRCKHEYLDAPSTVVVGGHVTDSIARVGEVLGLGPKRASLITAIGLAGLAVLVAQATRLSAMPTAVGFALIAVMAIVCFRWPLLALAAFVALIPIEEVVLIDGLGTISRFAGILFALTYGVPRLGRLHLGVMPPAAWAFLVWAVASVGWSIDPNTAWGELATLLQLFLIALLVADFVVQRPTIVRPILWVYSLSAAATAMVGIETFIALGPNADVRAAAIQGQNPAQFAAVLLPAFVFGLHEVLNGERRVLGGAIALLTSAGIVVSGTRGAWVSVAIVVLVFVLPRLQVRQQFAAIAMVLVIGLVTLQIPGVSNLLLERAGTAAVTGGSGRTDIWSVGVTIYWSAPVLGVGYANFPVAYTSDAVRASDVTFRFATQQGIGPHNLVVGTLIELGPIGLLALALFLMPLVLQRGWGPEAATVQAALASLLILALFLDILANRKQVWLVIGLAAGLAYLRRHAGSAVSSDRSASPDADGGDAIRARRVLRPWRATRAVVGAAKPPA